MSAERRIRTASFVVDRRTFIAGAGATFALAGLPATAADSSVTPVGRGVCLALDGGRWVVDPDLFGPAASVTYRWIDNSGHAHATLPESKDYALLIAHEIGLRGARFPGFSMRADFSATLYQRANRWLLRIGFFEGGGAKCEIPFAAWCGADDTERVKYRAKYAGKPIIIGSPNNPQNRIDTGRRPVQIEVDALFNFCLFPESAQGLFQFTAKQFRFSASGLTLSPEISPSDEANSTKPLEDASRISKNFAYLVFKNARFRHGDMVLGGVGGNLVAHLDYDECDARLLGFRAKGTNPSTDEAELSLSGSGALVCTGPGTGPIGSRVQLEKWCIEAPINGLRHEAYFRGWLSRQPFSIETAHFAVQMQGDGYSPVRCDINVCFSATPLSRIEFNGWLLGAHVPVIGASTAELCAPSLLLHVTLGQGNGPSSPNIDCSPNRRLHIGQNQALFQTDLDLAELRVKRSMDLLDLAFGFRRYALVARDGITRLVRVRHRPSDRACSGASYDKETEKHLLIVKFQPQYIYEQAFKTPGPAPANPAPGDRIPINYLCPAPDGTCRPLLAQTRIAARSRIVFHDKSESPVDGELLTVGYLTDWSNLVTVVNKRAQPRNVSLEEQLAVAGIYPATCRADAKQNIIANTQPPSEEETAIEPVYRLILSPDASASWRTSSATPDPRAPVMWSAELANASTAAVRVLWSRDMDLSFLNTTNCDLAPADAEFKSIPQFVGSLNQDDRRQLAEMMSVYGIAALRRIEITKGFAKDDPNGMVFLPKERYQALDPRIQVSATNPPVYAPQEGFVLGRPFDNTFALKLSRAATMTAKWIGEPPAPLQPDPNYPQYFNAAFTIDKYIHETQDGRDTFVEVSYKGFLFPIGHRAALLKITRREFWPEGNRADGPPVAYLIQHQYVAVRKPDKTFPAYAQPFSSLDFPAHTVTMKTVRTPDLTDPTPVPDLPAYVVGQVFWPQLQDNNKDVIFEYSIDNNATAKSPLLFVDNAAAHDPPTMQAVVQYYMGLEANTLLDGAPQPALEAFLRYADLGASAIQYADEKKGGQCSFKTSSWFLGARGLLSSTTDVGVAVTDAENAPDGKSVRLTLQGTKSGLTDLSTQTQVMVYGISGSGPKGSSALNGPQTIQPVSPSPQDIVLLGCSWNGKAYTSGGSVQLSAAPNIVMAVTGAKVATDGSGFTQLTVSGLKFGQIDPTTKPLVIVSNVGGTTDANGTWNISFATPPPPQIDLNTSTNDYVSGGYVSSSVVQVTDVAPDPAITNKAADGTPTNPILLTLNTLKFGSIDLTNTSSKVIVSGVLGTPEANGAWDFQVTDLAKNKITLKNSTYNPLNIQDPKYGYQGSGTASTVAIETQAYAMDAFMEGQDQPPFYPIVSKARITVDKVDQLTGHPNTAIEATFDPTYVQHGFDPSTNSSEIFLDILGPDIQLDPTANTSSSGGVATTNSLLVALARKSGLIGGTGNAPEKIVNHAIRKQNSKPAYDVPAHVSASCPPQGAGASSTAVPAIGRTVLPDVKANAPAEVTNPPAPGRQANLAPALPLAKSAPSIVPLPSPPLQPIPTPYNFASALAGRFDPIEFFGGALKDAKLLGIVPLKDILRAVLIAAAPQLEQATEYGAGLAQDLLKPAKRVVHDVSTIIGKVRTTANASLAKLSPNVTLQALYPDFSAALDRLTIPAPKPAATNAATAISQLPDETADLNQLFNLASQFKSDVDNLLKQMQQLAKDPMPTVVKDELQQLTDAWTNLRNFAQKPKDWADSLAGALLNQACNRIFSLIINPPAPARGPAGAPTAAQPVKLFELIFGKLADSATAYVDFPEPTPHTPPTVENLQRQFARIISNPSDVLPQVQQAIFYEVFAQPLIKAVTAVQNLQQQADGVVNWAQTALANQIASALRLKYSATAALLTVGQTAAGQIKTVNPDLTKYGWIILQDVQNALETKQKITVGQLPKPQELKTNIENAARISIQENLDDLKQSLKTFQCDADRARHYALMTLKDPSTVVDFSAERCPLLQDDKESPPIDTSSPERRAAMAAWASAQKTYEAFKEITTVYDNLISNGKLNDLVTAVGAAIQQQITSAAQNVEAQISEQAKALADSMAIRLFDIVSKALDTIIHSALASEIAQQSENALSLACDGVSDGYKVIWMIGVGLVQTGDGIQAIADKITSGLNDLTDQLTKLQIPATAPQDSAAIIISLRASLTRSIQQLGRIILEIEKVRLQLPDPSDANQAQRIKDYCKPDKALQLLDYVARCVDLRGRAAQAIVDSLTQIKAASEAWKKLIAAGSVRPGTGTPDLAGSLDKLGATLGQAALDTTIAYALTVAGPNDKAVANWNKLVATFNDKTHPLFTTDALDTVNAAFAEFTKFQNAAKNLSIPPQNLADALTLAGAVLQFTTLNDRKLVGLLLQGTGPVLGLWNGFCDELASAGNTIIGMLLTINNTVATAVQNVIDVVDPSSGSGSVPTMANILSQTTLSALKHASAQLQTDRNNLTKLQGQLTPGQAPDKVLQATRQLTDSWKQTKPGVIQAVHVVETIIEAVTTGHFSTLFNVADYQKQLKDAIEDLVPTRVRLNYDFNTALSDFPSGDPIFAMDPGYGTAGPGQSGEVVRNDLDLRTQVSVNLLTGERDVSALGFIRPFRLHMLGDALDLATIHFKGARFQVSPGAPLHFTADIAGAEIGALLAFLQVIEDYLVPGGGNGFYHTIDPLPLQIEVGYQFKKPYFPCGGLIFQNIDFDIGAILPMDGRQAEFHFELASRDQPFLISAPPPTPYGGGGFISLRASAQGVVAFEISLEFGAIFAIQFGPLHASARITAGIYLLSEGGYRVLQGFVQAVGEGNIACFSVAVLIQITTTQQSDSSMAGSSTYAFSFKISSFFELTYHVTASYKTQGGGKQQQNPGITQHSDDKKGPAEEISLRLARVPSFVPNQRLKPPITQVTAGKVRTLGPAMQTNWKLYSSYFDI